MLLIRERDEDILLKEIYSFKRAGYRGGKIFFWGWGGRVKPEKKKKE